MLGVGWVRYTISGTHARWEFPELRRQVGAELVGNADTIKVGRWHPQGETHSILWCNRLFKLFCRFTLFSVFCSKSLPRPPPFVSNRRREIPPRGSVGVCIYYLVGWFHEVGFSCGRGFPAFLYIIPANRRIGQSNKTLYCRFLKENKCGTSWCPSLHNYYRS